MKLVLLVLGVSLILFFIVGNFNMAEYEKAYKEYQQMYDSGSFTEVVDSSLPPVKRPKGLGFGTNTKKLTESLVEDIDISLEIYRRYQQERESNKELKNSKGAVKFSIIPPSRENASEDTAKIQESNIKDAGGRANKYFNDLKKEFPKLSTKQISAIIGNLDHESQGFTQFYERGVKIGGEGDAQWTAGRREDFRAFTEANDLNPKSYEASKEFLIYELKNNKVHGFENWDNFDSFNDPSKSVDELTRLFENRYLAAGKKFMSRRQKLAREYNNEFSQRNREE